MNSNPDTPSLFASVVEQYRTALLATNPSQASAVIRQCLAHKVPISSIYLDVICGAQRDLGTLWANNQISITLEHIATEISLAQISWLRLQCAPRPPIGLKIFIAAAPGEPHTFPARIIADLFYFDGWDVHFSGVQTPADDMLKFLRDARFDAVGLSVTLDPQPECRNFISKLRRIPRPPKIIVGGHAARRLKSLGGIDLIASDPRTAVIQTRNLFGKTGPEFGFAQLSKGLGARIAEVRRAKDLSQADVAATSGLDRGYLSALEHGKHNPTLHVIFKIAAALSVPVQDLFR